MAFGPLEDRRDVIYAAGSSQAVIEATDACCYRRSRMVADKLEFSTVTFSEMKPGQDGSPARNLIMQGEALRVLYDMRTIGGDIPKLQAAF